MKIRRGVVVACIFGVVFLAGCIGIQLLSLVQPTTGYNGKSFVARATAEIYDSGDAGADDDSDPVFAVNLPECFEVLGCMADINGDTYSCEELSELEDWILDIINQLFGSNWVVRKISNFPEGETLPYEVVFDWTILPKCTGSFNLDYLVWQSGLSGDVVVTVDSSMGHPIRIAAMPIPAMSGYSALIFAGLLLIASLAFMLLKKRQAGNPLRSIAPFLFAAAASILILGGISTAHAEDVKMDLTVENVKIFIQEAKSIKTVPTETARDVILANFNLTTEQAEFLAQLSDEDLEKMYETMLNAEDVDDVRCMFVNGTPPRAACMTIE